MPSKELKIAIDSLNANVKEFGILFERLIGRFEKYTESIEIKTLKHYWELAVGLIGITETVSLMIEYFLKYKELILASKVDELLAIDFSKDIVVGTEGKTANLIKKLIEIFKSTWLIASTTDQCLIKDTIKKMTLKAIIIDDLNKKIETLN